MILTLDNMKYVFQALIDGKTSREDTSTWAYKIMQFNDSYSLEYVPKEQEDLLWDAVSYLYMVDHQVEKDIYLISMENIIKYFDDFKKTIK